MYGTSAGTGSPAIPRPDASGTAGFLRPVPDQQEARSERGSGRKRRVRYRIPDARIIRVKLSHASQPDSDSTPWDAWDAWDSSHKGSDKGSGAGADGDVWDLRAGGAKNFVEGGRVVESNPRPRRDDCCPRNGRLAASETTYDRSTGTAVHARRILVGPEAAADEPGPENQSPKSPPGMT